jgi:hypothetical protein
MPDRCSIALELSVSDRTVGRILAGDRRLEDDELAAIARVLAVPESFLRDGFFSGPAAVDGQDQDQDVRDELARRHDELVRRLDDQAELLRTLMVRVEEVRDRLPPSPPAR